jgi:hypothetical protein
MLSSEFLNAKKLGVLQLYLICVLAVSISSLYGFIHFIQTTSSDGTPLNAFFMVGIGLVAIISVFLCCYLFVKIHQIVSRNYSMKFLPNYLAVNVAIYLILLSLSIASAVSLKRMEGKRVAAKGGTVYSIMIVACIIISQSWLYVYCNGSLEWSPGKTRSYKVAIWHTIHSMVVLLLAHLYNDYDVVATFWVHQLVIMSIIYCVSSQLLLLRKMWSVKEDLRRALTDPKDFALALCILPFLLAIVLYSGVIISVNYGLQGVNFRTVLFWNLVTLSLCILMLLGTVLQQCLCNGLCILPLDEESGEVYRPPRDT